MYRLLSASFSVNFGVNRFPSYRFPASFLFSIVARLYGLSINQSMDFQMFRGREPLLPDAQLDDGARSSVEASFILGSAAATQRTCRYAAVHRPRRYMVTE